MGSILKKALPIVGAVGGGLLGGAPGAAIGGSIGGMLGSSGDGTGGATNPQNYPNIKIPGLDYGNGTPTVNMPAYPNMQVLPYNMPTLPNPTLAPPTTGEMNMGNALSQSQASILALLNPSNPIFKSLSSEQEQLNNQDFLGGLNNIMTADRRSRAQGRGGVLNNERGGEQSMMAILNNARDAHLNAQMQSRSMLGDVANRLQGIAGGYGQEANLEQTRRNQLDINQQNYTNQLRSDDTTRNSQYNSNLLGSYNDQRDNIIQALNLARGNQAQLNNANATAQNYQRQDQGSMIQGIKDLLGGSSSGSGGSSMWQNPDTNQFLPIGSSSGSGGFLSGLFG